MTDQARKSAPVKISTAQILHVGTLASVTVDSSHAQSLATAFEETLAVIDNLKEVDTSKIEPTHQVTGLENVLREDEIDSKRMFTQAEAIANARDSYRGFFVVPAVLPSQD